MQLQGSLKDNATQGAYHPHQVRNHADFDRVETVHSGMNVTLGTHDTQVYNQALKEADLHHTNNP